MWIGSNVPPRIPVRTGPRIGLRRSDQSQCPGDVGMATPKLAGWIHIFSVDSDRHMDTRNSVFETCCADSLTSFNIGPMQHVNCRQIRKRYLETGHRLDRQSPHPGDAAGKRNNARRWRDYHVSRLRTEVNAPMPCVLTQRGIRLANGTVHRGSQTNCRNCHGQEHSPPPLHLKISVMTWQE